MIALTTSQACGGNFSSQQKGFFSGHAYLVVIVLHELPIEIAILGPGEVILDGVPIHARMLQHMLLIQKTILVHP